MLFSSAKISKIERTVEQTKNGPVINYVDTSSNISAHCWNNFGQYEVINPVFYNSDGSYKKYMTQDKSIKTEAQGEEIYIKKEK